jgi:hypothetical protein
VTAEFEDGAWDVEYDGVDDDHGKGGAEDVLIVADEV